LEPLCIQEQNLEGIRTCHTAKGHPENREVPVFDASLKKTLDRHSSSFVIPEGWQERVQSGRRK
jgi:acetate kinase